MSNLFGGPLRNSGMHKATSGLLDEVLKYTAAAGGLSADTSERGFIKISQKTDGKIIRFAISDLHEILERTDVDGKAFLQVNFKSGTKVLVTDALVGFKPNETLGLDLTRIPKVVTTPDLLSVFEAIEEALGGDTSSDHETEVLKKVYLAILLGGEKVGFDLKIERRWLDRLIATRIRASA